MIKHFVRPTAEAETQTKSLKQLTLEYENKIKDLEKKMEVMQEEYQRMQDATAKLNQKVRNLT